MKTIVYPLKVSKSIFINYCYLVLDIIKREIVLIDPAWEIEKIKQQIENCNAKPTAILLTHHHFDHVNLAESFANQYNIPVYMSETEIEYYQFTCNNLTAIRCIDAFWINQIKISPLFTPGHTKGAISYWIDNAIFTGDTLFIEGCGMCTGMGSDPNALFDSLSFLKDNIPPETKIFPGHSYGEEPGQSFTYLLQNNIYLQINKREDFINYRMRKNQTALFSFK